MIQAECLWLLLACLDLESGSISPLRWVYQNIADIYVFLESQTKSIQHLHLNQLDQELLLVIVFLVINVTQLQPTIQQEQPAATIMQPGKKHVGVE